MNYIFLDSPLDGNEPDWYEKNLKVHSAMYEKNLKVHSVVRLLNSYSSFKAQNRACKLRNISSNIIHHLEGRSELRGALTCEIGFLRVMS